VQQRLALVRRDNATVAADLQVREASPNPNPNPNPNPSPDPSPSPNPNPNPNPSPNPSPNPNLQGKAAQFEEVKGKPVLNGEEF
jgi:hypothetical protein